MGFNDNGNVMMQSLFDMLLYTSMLFDVIGCAYIILASSSVASPVPQQDVHTETRLSRAAITKLIALCALWALIWLV